MFIACNEHSDARCEGAWRILASINDAINALENVFHSISKCMQLQLKFYCKQFKSAMNWMRV